MADFFGATFSVLESFLLAADFCFCFCFDLPLTDSDSEALEADDLVVLVVGNAFVLGLRDGGFLAFLFFDLSSELSDEELFLDPES